MARNHPGSGWIVAVGVVIRDRQSVPCYERGVAPSGDVDGRIARLERAGAVRSAQGPPATELLSRQPPSLRRGASAVGALIDERRGGR